jgi:hypothetical protein
VSAVDARREASVARPLLTTPRPRRPDGPPRATDSRVARQPVLGLLGGLVFVVPFTVALAFGVRGAEGSVLVLGPLTTFALPVVAMIAFWWEDWPGTRLRADWAGWADTVLVVVGAVVLTLAGQAVTARSDPVGIFDPTAGPEHAPTFPITMPLAGTAFVVLLQLTLACERWPMSRLGRTSSGALALVVSWSVALLLTWTVIAVVEPVNGARPHPGLMDAADFGALVVTVGVWQTVLFVVLRGWPLNLIGSRTPRLLANNAAVVAGAVPTYWALSSAGVAPGTISAAGGCTIAAGLVVGMLFEGWPPRAGHGGTLALAAVVSAALFVVLTGIAGTSSFQRATSSQWVTHAALSAIALPVVLHVGIGRRWPFRRIRRRTGGLP